MMTAEQFLRNKFNINEDKPVSEYLTDVEFEETMIEFAKLHVEAALKEAKWRCDDTTNSEGLGLYVENSYPLENIK